MSTEIQKTEQTDVKIYDANVLSRMDASYGAADDVTADDIKFPIVSLQHPMSKKVLEGITRPGVIYHYGLEKEIGTKDQPMHFVPIKFFKYFRIVDHKTRAIISNRPWRIDDCVNFDRNDGFKEYEVIEYYILTKEDFLLNTNLPSRMTFYKTSLKAAKTLNTQLSLLRPHKIKPWDYFFKLTTKLNNSKDPAYYEIYIAHDTKEPLTQEQKIATFGWVETMDSLGFNKKIEKDIVNNSEEIVEEQNNPIVTGEPVYNKF